MPPRSVQSHGLGSARLGSARLGSARLGSARLGSARLGSARLGSARLGSARLGSAILSIVLRRHLSTPVARTRKHSRTSAPLCRNCGDPSQPAFDRWSTERRSTTAKHRFPTWQIVTQIRRQRDKLSMRDASRHRGCCLYPTPRSIAATAPIRRGSRWQLPDPRLQHESHPGPAGAGFGSTARAPVTGTDDSSSLTGPQPCGLTRPMGTTGVPPRRMAHESSSGPCTIRNPSLARYAVGPRLHDRATFLEPVIACVRGDSRRAIHARQRELRKQLVHIVLPRPALEARPEPVRDRKGSE